MIERDGLPLHISQALDDVPIAYAHDVDATYARRVAIAPSELPANDAALAADPDFLILEGKIRRGCDVLPEAQACLPALIPCAVRRGCRILENAVLGDQIIKILWAMRLESVMEARDDVARGFGIVGHLGLVRVEIGRAH